MLKPLLKHAALCQLKLNQNRVDYPRTLKPSVTENVGKLEACKACTQRTASYSSFADRLDGRTECLDWPMSRRNTDKVERRVSDQLPAVGVTRFLRVSVPGYGRTGTKLFARYHMMYQPCTATRSQNLACPPDNPDALFPRSHRVCRSLGYPRPFGLNSSQEFNPIRVQDVMSLISSQCEQADELKQRQLKLGLDAFQEIERDDEELSRWLRDAFMATSR